MEKTTVIYGKENDAGANDFQLEAVEIHHVNPYAFHTIDIIKYRKMYTIGIHYY